jgi:hypothetical protein
MFVPEQYKMTDPVDVLSLMQANPPPRSSAMIDGLTATHLPTVTRRGRGGSNAICASQPH